MKTLLHGTLVSLRDLTSDDASALLASAMDPEVWRWKLVPMPESVDDLRALIDQVMIGPGRLPLVAVRRVDGRAIGTTTLANFDWHHKRVEMGFTWLERPSWGRGFNEDMKLTLLRHCFDDLGLERVEWQCDAANERSWRALDRLGFSYEGTLRSRHVRPDGTRRDSMFYGLVRGDWPAAAERLSEQVSARADRR